jgi:hypothetical protein
MPKKITTASKGDVFRTIIGSLVTVLVLFKLLPEEFAEFIMANLEGVSTAVMVIVTFIGAVISFFRTKDVPEA